MDEETFVGELKKIFPQSRHVVLGPGDDCAAVRFPGKNLLLLAADQVIENIHFTPDTPPELAGEKLVKRNVSDVAAMGGKPLYALLCCTMFPLDHEYLLRFHKGAAEACRKYGLCITGGDTASLPGPGKVFSLSIMGELPEHVLKARSGAREGDLLYATGRFGRSFESGKHLTFEPRLAEGIFLGKQRFVHAMMDVSDGLLKDSLRMADASGKSIFFDFDSIPLTEGASLEDALCDGEDYELLFAADPSAAEALERSWPSDTLLSRIGTFEKRSPAGAWANPVPLTKKGFDHFL